MELKHILTFTAHQQLNIYVKMRGVFANAMIKVVMRVEKTPPCSLDH